MNALSLLHDENDMLEDDTVINFDDDRFTKEVVQLNLSILEKLESNQKLRINRNHVLYVDQSLCTSLSRWMRNDNRHKTVAFLEKLIKHAKEHLDTDHTNYGLLMSLTRAVVGLEKLQTTYQNDIIVKSKIGLMITELNEHVRNQRIHYTKSL